MRHSVFTTLKLLILGNIFLIPLSIVVENLIIRLIIGSVAGISFIMLLSFITKIEAIYTKDKKY